MSCVTVIASFTNKITKNKVHEKPYKYFNPIATIALYSK